jgi:nitrite reductase (NADH) small subunit
MDKLWIYVAEEDSVPKGEGRRIEIEGREIALFRTAEGWFAVDNQCPHKKGPLSDGIVAGKAVFCPLHSWKIDLTTGCAVAGGEGKIKNYPVKAAEGRVYLDLTGGAS